MKERTAAVAYKEHETELYRKICDLQFQLKVYRRKHNANPKNWAFVGSLEKSSKNLGMALFALGHPDYDEYGRAIQPK
ncbi:hypothetical protein HY522_06090 [bacterium]|nr:hypothetical protein [bacterium]